MAYGAFPPRQDKLANLVADWLEVIRGSDMTFMIFLLVTLKNTFTLVFGLCDDAEPIAYSRSHLPGH